MTRHAPGDEYQTSELIRFYRGPQSWLRHRGRAARLDRLLLRGASMEELQAVATAVPEHIRHLRTVHNLRVEETNGTWRIEAP